MIINMGPQHPSTHGVLRLLLELDGETVIKCTPIIGYLHTGIEKNTEYRTWMQGVTFVTRADYLSPFFNELGYCLAVERLLGVEAPPRAQVIRVLMNELNRISSHLVWLATGGLELGAVSVMLYGFREREVLLDIFEEVTGLRMNHAYIRIGGVIMDLPEEGVRKMRRFLEDMPARIDDYERCSTDNPIWLERNEGVGVLSAERCARARRDRPDAARGGRAARRAQGRPLLRLRDLRLRRAGPHRGRLLRAVPPAHRGDARVDEDRRASASTGSTSPGPVMIEDPKVAWPAKLCGRARRHRQRPRVPHPHHGGVDGGADPSLQDGDRGRRGAGGRGLPGGRVARGASSASTWSPTASTARTA